MVQDTRERYINPYTDFAKYSEAERRQYEASQKEYWDYTSTLETAELKGEKRGEMKGREEGRKEIARKMKADGLPDELIAKYTGLSVDEIEDV